ncbi:MAG: hypothetical protein AAFV19_01270 [Pseudomonadota bacterium]
MDGILTSATSRQISLLVLRLTLAGLIFWWGLVKGLNIGVGANVSDKYYGGTFSQEILLIAFGWFQVVLAVMIALGPWRRFTLPVMFVINAFVAAAVWQSIIDPFWLWMGGEKPGTVNALFYPSAVVVAGCWVLIAFRREDRLAFGPH